MKQIRLGAINFDDASITKNKIRYAVLDIVREIVESIEINHGLGKEVDKLLEGNKGHVAK
jgi:hypothetical protein